MKKVSNSRNANFTRLIELTKNRDHDLHGVPLTIVLVPLLQMGKDQGINAVGFQLGMITMKVGMEDQTEEIIDYCAKNIDAAIAETMDHTPLDW